MTISAVIFDLDGTVLTNEEEYGAAFRSVLRLLGKRVDKKYPHVRGIGVKENWQLLLSKYKIRTNKTLEELTLETQNEFLKRLGTVTFKKGFEKFIKDLKDSGILVALATSNAWWVVDEISEVLPINHYFDIITTGEEVEYKKPDPDLFLITSEKLGVESGKCLVIEDSAPGIEAAHRAGMRVVGIVRDGKNRQELKEADMVIESFYDLSSKILSSL
jgi:HAD superfamily hydrolase (TIGR01509 family)